MARLLVHLSGLDEALWAQRFATALPGHEVFTTGGHYDPSSIDYIFVWKPRANAFDGLTKLRAVLSYGAGVDALVQHAGLPDRPIVRFVDPDLTQRMTDYVLAQVLLHARAHLRFAADQATRSWAPYDPPPANRVSVGVMGMGVLGRAAAQKLVAVGYDVRCWSRTATDLGGVTAFASAQFDAFLAGTDILVNLLPLTPETRGILNYETFAKLRRGAAIDGPVVINAARGGHQREADLVRALGDGTLRAASLDVFEVEPLPITSPLWALQNCVITPHVAATSGIEACIAYHARIILEHEAGAPLPNIVDRQRGY